ncbi:hypothetical protein [Sinobacterium norvegicum]|uniref:hypothetical protein n=1 Tax=Sinobacterium norvegicum TaxID=1641715 RepID=UPI001F40CC96|nr:hypothetical protein [Sinobacterium norvegicum]
MNKVNFLAILPPVLACAGVAISSSEVQTFTQSGWKIAIVAMLVFTGTFVGSALIGEPFLNV